MTTGTMKLAAGEALFEWEGRDREGRTVRGEMRARNDGQVRVNLRRQGIVVAKVKRRRFGTFGQTISEKDVSLFTRQLATMMKAGVPMLQAFDIVARGHTNPAMGRLLLGVKQDIESGSSLAAAFRKHPAQFDHLYCNLIEAGEAAGVLDTLLDRLAAYKEKILSIKGKIKAAMYYPSAIVVTAFVITAVIMIFVIPAFKELFTSFGADLPAPTLFVIWLSDQFVRYWWLIFGGLIAGIAGFFIALKRSRKLQIARDRIMLRLPVLGEILHKATVARWTRTLSTMFAAGVPLVEALDSVGGAAGNEVYAAATKRIQTAVSTGTSLTVAMQDVRLFPNMVLQMAQIGEESGSLDSMLSKVADFYEEDVDTAVSSLSSLLEPAVMIVLGVLIGGLVIAMYLPIFRMGQVVG